jgi:trehalose 6-phosphate phosphatase
VAELLPAHAGKGPVIEWFLQRRPYRGRRPIFIGDDLTDEHGFAAVNRLDGLSVRVGDGDTIARHRIRTPADVRHRLARWAASGAIRFDEEIAA